MMQLNNIKVGSGPAQLALENRLKSDVNWYKNIYSKFVVLATSNAHEAERAMEYSVRDFAGTPDAYSTLVHIAPLDNELGAIIQNATIFAIATTSTYYLKGTMVFPGIAKSAKTTTGERPYSPTKSWDDYIEYMFTNHPNTVAIVNQIRLGLTARRKYKMDILAVMGYLIEQAEITLSNRRNQILR